MLEYNYGFSFTGCRHPVQPYRTYVICALRTLRPCGMSLRPLITHVHFSHWHFHGHTLVAPDTSISVCSGLTPARTSIDRRTQGGGTRAARAPATHPAR